MSASPEIRRKDKQLNESDCWRFLTDAYCGRLGTVSADGEPYITPLLHVVADGAIWMHTTVARGHVRTNIGNGARACFEVDAAGEVYGYGRFECDTGMAYESVIAFGSIAAVEEEPLKVRFFDSLMAKYARHLTGRPTSFYPRIDVIAVYKFAVQRITGKRTLLPAVADQWPARDRTMTPNARLPD
jgi:hypothetical protein